MFQKEKLLKKNFKEFNYLNYFFLKNFLNKDGKIFFKKKYKKSNNWIKRKIKKSIKRLRFISLMPYTFKHFLKKRNKC